MNDRINSSVSFECRTRAEAELILRAMRGFRRVLADRGDDARNYAPAIPGFAGFGWDAVIRAAMDMGQGTVTHMSGRMAEGMREALESYASQTVNRDDRSIIVEVMFRLNTLLSTDGAAELPNPWAVEDARILTPMGPGTVTSRDTEAGLIFLRLDGYPEESPSAMIADNSPEIRRLDGE
ncbi:hypothetical protein OG800_49295 (plasmid) [Streptomyces sp. NBC_00445]|uniref:hypothetical protein n=1 Tax=Streptomyces sp. NBC_00445 TaxID=2975745 RepID=UPI002E1E289E